MDPLLVRLTPVLHLTRITTAFAAVANVWLVLLWSRAEFAEKAEATGAVRDSPLWVLLGGGTAMAVGLFAFGTALNDTLDVRRDRSMNPNRPVASGAMPVEVALAWTLGALLVAVLGSAALGVPAVIMCLGTAVAVMLYNAALRFLPAVGLVMLGLIYGAHMMAANVHLAFIWPVWLSMTHALFAGAVTHRLRGARPALNGGTLAAAVLAYAVWSAVLIFVGWRRMGGPWPEWELSPLAAILPSILAVGFIVLAWRKSRTAGTSRAAADKVQRYAALWLALYAAGWMLGAGHRGEALLLGGLALAGFLGMTVLRELFSLIEHPVGYRR